MDAYQLRTDYIKHATRIVIKVGSNVLTENQGLNIKAIRRLTIQICELLDQEKEIIIVSSGAMAAGIRKLNFSSRPTEIPKRQAIAAVGQATLMREYEKAFEFFDRKVAQLLLTSEDLSDRERYLNARNTLQTLLSWKVIPIVNENDTVSIAEIKFGDNDNLSALISLLTEADLLIILTDISGLYDKDPRTSSDATIIPYIKTITKSLETCAGEIPGALGTGGMMAKLKAAKKLMSAGIPMIIAGERKDILRDIFSGKEEGSFFIPKTEKMCSKKRWMAFSVKPKGQIQIDDGAAKAILTNGKSLLPIGIHHISGDFKIGDTVELISNDNRVLGIGLVNYPMKEINIIKGLKSSEIESRLGSCPYDEVIHRNNMVLSCF